MTLPRLALVTPALLLVLTGCGGGAAESAAEGTAPSACAEAAAGSTTAEEAEPTVSSGVPRPVPKRDPREQDLVTPEQAELVKRLHELDRSLTQGSAERASRSGRLLVLASGGETHGAAEPAEHEADAPEEHAAASAQPCAPVATSPAAAEHEGSEERPAEHEG